MKENNVNKKKKGIQLAVTVVFWVIIIIGGIFLYKQRDTIFQGENQGKNIQKKKEQDKVKSTTEPTKKADDYNEVVKEADRLASGYDYNQAIQKIESIKNYDEVDKLVSAINKYKNEKKKLVRWEDNTKISHIFFHTLIADPSKAFDGDSRQDGYNQVMTTIDEFNKIMKQMYERGYVLVSIHDISKMEKQKDGTEKMVEGEIWLPKGKKPFVLSQDDVSYYTYMEGDGFASKLIIGENGKVTNEMVQDDGTIVTGSYDVLPLLEDFIEQHPDFSYQGARGILALTGYNGILGYRTCPSDDATTDVKKATEEAKKVAEAIKEQGWEFASHSWGHRGMGSQKLSLFKEKVEQWDSEVASIIGKTDILIYPFGEDIGDWREYSGEKYEYLKKYGFNYFCNVDGSSPYWVQLNDNYLRQGRMNLDGIRMYEDLQGKDRLSTFFNVEDIFDKSRPLPVPPM